VDWFDAVPFDKILNGSGWAVAFWTLLGVSRFILKGDLVPRKTYEDVLDALVTERARNDLLLKQLEKVTDGMETFERFVRALPQPSSVPTPGPVGRAGRNPKGAQSNRRGDHGQDPTPRASQWGNWDPPGSGGE